MISGAGNIADMITSLGILLENTMKDLLNLFNQQRQTLDFDAIKIALKETSLAGSKIYIGGSGSNNKDIQLYAKNDLMIAAIAAFVLIFLIMMIITRSLLAALVIPGTVAFSYAGAFGLSVLIWQHLIGLPLHWLILPLTFIVKPELDRDVRTITLSYAFFNLSEEKLAASDRVEP